MVPTSTTLHVPPRSLVAYELPILTSSTESAVAALGGPAALEAVTSALPQSAVAYLRPADVFSHGITGRREPEPCGFLLRLMPETEPGGAGIGTWRPTIIGRVSTSYAFDAAADFQFTGSSAVACPNFPVLISHPATSAQRLSDSCTGFAVPPAEFVDPRALTAVNRRDPRGCLRVAAPDGATLNAGRAALELLGSAHEDFRVPSEGGTQDVSRVDDSAVPPDDASMLNAYFGECQPGCRCSTVLPHILVYLSCPQTWGHPSLSRPYPFLAPRLITRARSPLLNSSEEHSQCGQCGQMWASRSFLPPRSPSTTGSLYPPLPTLCASVHSRRPGFASGLILERRLSLGYTNTWRSSA